MAIATQNFAELRTVLTAGDTAGLNFTLLQDLCAFAAQHDNEAEVNELVLRALEKRQAFGEAAVILDALARQIGLFPYLEAEQLSFADWLAYQAHRPQGMPGDIVFHHPQAAVFQKLMDGENVVLSAPTSFGKSLIIDALIASDKFPCIVIIVPTLALIDETRRRIADRFRGRYKVLTHRSQIPGDRNVYVLTQERALEHPSLTRIDLLIIDEFYKLNLTDEDDHRAALLNQAFYRLFRKAKQFYMLGPFIQSLSEGFRTKVTFRFIKENFVTVASELHRVAAGEDRMTELVKLCRTLADEPTIVFCGTPPRAAEVASRLVAEGLGRGGPETTAAADWVAQHFHADWHFGIALRHGIGVHHGRVPRALAQYVVRLFNDDHLPVLVCTSTLIEGVNTKAKNIVIFDNKINREPLDLFTFNNIRGRSGRMMRHFVGRVFIFDDPPTTGYPTVDVPIISQPPTAPESLLIQIDEGDLTPESRNRLARFAEQEVVSYATLQANTGVDLQQQIDLAQDITANITAAAGRLGWHGIPNYDDLLFVADLMWRHFNGNGLAARSVASHRHLTLCIHRLRNVLTTRQVIDLFLGGPNPPAPDEAVRRALDFLRLWANFHFPRLLRAIDRIQRDVLGRQNPPLPAGNYEYFAARVENFFLDPALVALDEYGLPLEIARKIQGHLSPNGELDAVLTRLKGLDCNSLPLTDFEKRLVLEVQESL